MKLRDAVICWNPPAYPVPGQASGAVAVFDHSAGLQQAHDARGWRGYRMMVGHCDYDTWGKAHGLERVVLMFAAFHALVVRDGIEPKAAHAAFLEIDEYRERISPDVEGADA